MVSSVSVQIEQREEKTDGLLKAGSDKQEHVFYFNRRLMTSCVYRFLYILFF